MKLLETTSNMWRCEKYEKLKLFLAVLMKYCLCHKNLKKHLSIILFSFLEFDKHWALLQPSFIEQQFNLILRVLK